MNPSAHGAVGRRPTARAVALDTIRNVGRVIAVVAAVFGIGVTVLAIIGPSVWVFADDGSGAGSFVAMPIALRLVHAVAVALPCATVVLVALLLADLAGRVREEVVFLPSLTRTTTILAVAVGVGSWLTQIAQNLARWAVVVLSDGATAGTADPPAIIEWNVGLHTLAPDWTLLGLAVVLGVMATVIRAGERLQRETEGLV